MNIIELKNICKSYGEKNILTDLSLSIEKNKFTCIMGPSGSGKTTLLYMLAGLSKPTAGEIAGADGKISFVFQEDRLCEDFTAVANIRFVSGKNAPQKDMEQCLGELGLADHADLPVKKLSGGMQRRVALARGLLAPYDILLLDEPLKGLDEALKADVMTYLKKATAGKTVICVTHDPDEAAFLADRTLTMPERKKTKIQRGITDDGEL